MPQTGIGYTAGGGYVSNCQPSSGDWCGPISCNPTGPTGVGGPIEPGGAGGIHFGPGCLPQDPADPNSSTIAAQVRSTDDIGSLCRKLFGWLKSEFSPPHIYPLVFDEGHFWTQHFAGTGFSSSLSTLENAIYVNAQAQIAANDALPEALNNSQTFSFPFDDNGTMVTVYYRMFFVTEGATASKYGPYVSIGTAYFSKP